MAIEVKGIDKRYGTLQVYRDFSLEFPENRITAILGPSGCGKTTLLRLLAGLAGADRGAVTTPLAIGYLFQEPRLLPWMTLRDNIALVLVDKLEPAEVRRRVGRMLNDTGLVQYGDYFPNQVSGGMKQRAAIARAFAYPSRLLLMDEPFKSLDLKTRHQLVGLFLKLWRNEPRTVVTVTHDLREALWLGDQIVVLSEKPAQVMDRIAISLPQEERLGNEELEAIERKLYRTLLG